MLVEHDDGEHRTKVIQDFVVATPAMARKLIADGAINGRDLLIEAGLSPAEAEAELARLKPPTEGQLRASGPQS